MQKSITYQRGEYTFELLDGVLYSMNHYWFMDLGEGRIRCGFTPMVSQSMGETIDFEITINQGVKVVEYDVIGWIESMKAQNDLYALMSGIFVSSNPHLDIDLDDLVADPMGNGWLYEIQGHPPEHCFTLMDYLQHLDSCFEAHLGQS